MVMGLESLIFGSVLLMLFAGILSLLAFIFWIMMLIDSIQRKYKNKDEKIIWILVIILTYLVGALVYYFVVKRKKKR